MITPSIVLDLFLNEFLKVDALIKMIGFRSRITNPAFGIKFFSNLETDENAYISEPLSLPS